MGMRPRPFMTLFLALGLVGVVSISTLFASGQLPGVGGFDAAQTQYEDDDDDGKKDKKDKKNKKNKKDKDDDDDGDQAAVPPPGGGVLGTRSDCGVFRQNFGGNSTKQGACTVATQRVLTGTETPQQACAAFSKRRPRGFRRSDYGACLRSIQLSQTAVQRVLTP